MTDIDDTPGGMASGNLGNGKSHGTGKGGGDGGGGGGGPSKANKVESEHYDENRQRPLMTLEYARSLAPTKWIKYFNTYMESFPDLRDLDYRDNRGRNLDKHTSYPVAAFITAKGEVLGDGARCTHCGTDKRKNTGTFKDCVAFNKGAAYEEVPGDAKSPVYGSCNNCFFGGLGSKCSLREAPAPTKTRKRPADSTDDTQSSNDSVAGTITSAGDAQVSSSRPFARLAKKIKTKTNSTGGRKDTTGKGGEDSIVNNVAEVVHGRAIKEDEN